MEGTSSSSKLKIILAGKKKGSSKGTLLADLFNLFNMPL